MTEEEMRECLVKKIAKDQKADPKLSKQSIARDKIGVSLGYLYDVLGGKRPVSAKVCAYAGIKIQVTNNGPSDRSLVARIRSMLTTATRTNRVGASARVASLLGISRDHLNDIVAGRRAPGPRVRAYFASQSSHRKQG